MKVALIIVAGSEKQNQCFWPSYQKSTLGIDCDLIVVHRNMAHVPEIYNANGKVILENKIFSHGELPHKAFGAYREYWNRYQNKYDVFGFISDDVIIKTDNWVYKAVSLLNKYEMLGFVGTQIFNGLNNEYPHPSHCRAPAWFAKSRALKLINWQFDSDHDGEMRIADQFLDASFFGAQIGNKIDLAYDSLENGGYYQGDHISAIFEKEMGHNLSDKWESQELQNLNNKLFQLLKNRDDSFIIKSPHDHIGKRKLITQLQPFNGLLFDKSYELALPFVENLMGMYILKDCLE